MTRLSVVLPTVRGQDSGIFARARASVERQLESGDQLIIVDDNAPGHQDKGAWARNQGMHRARGTHIMFLDDDDVYLSGALAAAREAAGEFPTLFRVRYPACGGLLNWRRDDGIVWGEISTLGILVPNRMCLPDWDGMNWTNHESKFLVECEQRLGRRTVLRPEIIAEALGA